VRVLGVESLGFFFMGGEMWSFCIFQIGLYNIY
jgi:hypothetical protein